LLIVLNFLTPGSGSTILDSGDIGVGDTGGKLPLTEIGNLLP